MQDKLIKKDREAYCASQSTFKVANSFGHQGLRNYYTYWVQQSVSAIDIPAELRRFRSLQMPLTPEEFEELNKIFQEFVLTNLSRFEKNTTHQRRLYVLNSSLFPVTEIL